MEPNRPALDCRASKTASSLRSPRSIPNTIVVLNTGQAIAMPWLDKVRAVLEMWYTGDEGGWAAANLLTGKTSPAGRLPFTWPRLWKTDPQPIRLTPSVLREASPARRVTTRASTSVTDGSIVMASNHCSHSASAFRIAPSYARLSVRRAPMAGSTWNARFATSVRGLRMKWCRSISARLKLRPRERRSRCARWPTSRGSRCRQEFARRVKLHVAPERMRYWSMADSAWRVAPGARTVYVGRSSRDLPLTLRIPDEGRDGAGR